MKLLPVPVLAEPPLMGSNADPKASGEARESAIEYQIAPIREADSRGGFLGGGDLNRAVA